MDNEGALNHKTHTERAQPYIVKKKELPRLTFKTVVITDETVTLTDLCESFQTLYNVISTFNIKLNNELVDLCNDECILAHTGDQCMSNAGLSQGKQVPSSESLESVFRVLAEGLQAALAAF